MSSLHAFELRADVADTYQGGVATLSDGDFNVAEALAAGNGRVIVDALDNELLTFLSTYPPLKKTSLDGATEPTVRRYDLMSVEQLRDEAARRGIPRHGSGSGDDVRAALLSHDAALYAADAGAVAAVTVGQPALYAAGAGAGAAVTVGQPATTTRTRSKTTTNAPADGEKA